MEKRQSYKGEYSNIQLIDERKISEWKARVNVRDNFTCKICGKIGVSETHHIKPKSLYPELAYDINNGITLCKDCHSKQPSIAGRKKTKNGKTIALYIRFKAINMLDELSHIERKSKSQYVEDLITKEWSIKNEQFH